MSFLENDGIIVGSRKGYILDKEGEYYYVVYTHQLIKGKLKPIDLTKIYKVKEGMIDVL